MASARFTRQLAGCGDSWTRVDRAIFIFGKFCEKLIDQPQNYDRLRGGMHHRHPGGAMGGFSGQLAVIRTLVFIL
jgi:hypothetical protein